MQHKGDAHIKKQTLHTINVFGEVSDIQNKVLKVIDRNKRGDCLCLLPTEDNLIDVDYRDVQQFIPNISIKDPLEAMVEMLRRAYG